ncbi:ABC transporter permease [Sphingomonas sp.]|jgi:ABC-type nitrate/sulfonate/bicarbonate transport system permease component|uniref:ABC transporter permease n=1 Tax=Sphingomonas sp. TaxID=28214 RepID=UPI002EDA1EBB
MMTRGRAVRIELASIIALLALWYALTAWLVPFFGTTMAIFFPTPDKIAAAFGRDFLSTAGLLTIGQTLWRFILGFALSVVLGVGAGLVLGAYPLLYRGFDPFIGFFRSLPGATLIPALTLLLGLGDTSKIALIVSAAVWPILINTVDGARAVDPTMRETAAAYQIRRGQAMWRILLPAAAPSIVVGMRVAVSVGLVVTIISELVGASNGIGGYLVDAQASFALPRLWAALLLLSLLGYGLNMLFSAAEHRWLAWHRGARSFQE